MPSLIQLVYTSRARSPIDETMITSILTVSKEHNAKNNITGFLMARGEYFLQLLEGPDLVVRSLYDRIKEDERHHRITLQGIAPIDDRIMENWNMGYITELKEFQTSAQAILELFDLARDGKVISNPKTLEAMLRIFSRDAQII